MTDYKHKNIKAQKWLPSPTLRKTKNKKRYCTGIKYMDDVRNAHVRLFKINHAEPVSLPVAKEFCRTCRRIAQRKYDITNEQTDAYSNYLFDALSSMGMVKRKNKGDNKQK